MSPTLLIGLLVAAAILLGVLTFVLRDNGTEKTSSRLEILVGKRGGSDSPELLKEAAFGSEQKSFLEKLAAKVPKFARIFEQADCHIKPNTLFLIGGLLGLVGLTGGWLAKVPFFFMPIPGVLLALVPLGWLWNKRRKRLKTFASQLPDAMELVARALRAGHSLGAGMHVVAEEMPSPIADEFGRVYEEQNLGIPLEEAMREMCERVPNLDLRFFVTSVAIQRQTGGDLAEILDKIGYVIRERFRILGQVKALTAEGRLSGIVLVGLPFFLFVVMVYLKPEYIKDLWETPMGIRMSLIALGLQILGAAVIKKIVDIKV